MNDEHLTQLWAEYHRVDRAMDNHPGRSVHATPEQEAEFDLLREQLFALDAEIKKVERA